MYKYLLILVLSLGLFPNVYAQKQGNALSKLSNATVSDETIDKLCKAVENGKINTVKKIVESGLSSTIMANVKNKDGKTPMIIAADKGYIEIVKYLGNNGAKVNTTDNNGNTALCYAAKHLYKNIIDILLSLNAHPNIKCTWKNGWDKEVNTPLHLVVYKWDSNKQKEIYSHSLTEKFLSLGLDINSEDSYGQTPLTLAVHTKDINFVKYLLSKGANVNKGEPLWDAIYMGNFPMTKFLVEKGAKAYKMIGDDVWVYPVNVARTNGGAEMAEYLRKKGFEEDLTR